MEYEGPTREDLANVHALNRAWLRLQRQDTKDRSRLSQERLERLASTPFLLFSLSEHDDSRWRSLLDRGPQQDLLDARVEVSTELLALQAAGLAFLWDLARRNPYVARLVTGAPLQWCELIASTTLIRILNRVTHSPVIESRFDGECTLSRRLWRRGGSALAEMRVFSQIGALQSMLTSRELVPYRRMPAAACRMPRQAERLADKV